jgi:hypothetical protein
MCPRFVRPAFRLAAGALALAGATAGCGDPLSLLPPAFSNRVDTVTMWAAHGTPIINPSGYLIAARAAVRLDQVASFDFLYDQGPQNERIFLPLAALTPPGGGLGNAGFQLAAEPFDAIDDAPQSGYVSTDTVYANPGDVFYLRSAVNPSCVLGIPYYAKLEVLSADPDDRNIRFRILANVNCGYRSLEVGLPRR